MQGKIEMTDYVIMSAFLHMGYSVTTALNELIDNAKDAGSTRIDIDYNPTENRLTIKDNGKGMSFQHLQNAFNVGFKRMYDASEIGNFGIGINTGCLNVLKDKNTDASALIVTSDGIEKTSLLWKPFTNGLQYDIHPIVPDNIKGTTITLNEVKSINPTYLRKDLSVIFYPTLKHGKLKIFVNNIEVIGLDPLYRDSELTICENTIAEVNGQYIDIRAVALHPNQAKHSWDRETRDGEWAACNGGIYAEYGGRYIEYGGTYPHSYKNPWDSSTRIEFTIPKILTDEFDIHLNKTQSVNFHKNENIPDVLRKLRDIFNWGKKIRLQRNKDNTKASTDEVNQEITKIANDRTMNPYLKQGRLGYVGKNIKLDLNSKAEEMLAALSANNTQGYGARIPQFIIENSSLTLSPPSKNEGDAILYIASSKFSLIDNKYITEIVRKLIEIKVSYCDINTNSTFAIVRTKPTQKLDYYIICLVERIFNENNVKKITPDNYVGYFYLLPAAYVDESPDFKRNAAGGTREANKDNKNIELRFTIEKEEAFEKFGKYNLSRGTSFNDLVECIDYLNNVDVTNITTKELKKKKKLKVKLVTA
jgi:hypothetical protein